MAIWLIKNNIDKAKRMKMNLYNYQSESLFSSNLSSVKWRAYNQLQKLNTIYIIASLRFDTLLKCTI